MGCVRTRALGRLLMLIYDTALFLLRKYREAVKHKTRYYDALYDLEQAIKVKYPGKLPIWKAEEAEWLQKVLSVTGRVGLKNPYDLAQLTSTQSEECEATR